MTGPVLDFHARLLPGQESMQDLLATMDRCGIDRAVVSAGGVLGIDTLSRQLIDGGHVTTDPPNDAVLSTCARTEGRLLPFYFGNPHRSASRYQEQASRWRGLEVSPAVHGVALLDRRVRALIEVAAQAGHPVYIVCLDRPGCAVPDLLTLAREFVSTTFVLGHCGIGNIDFHALNLIADCRNVLVESSGGYSSVAGAAVARLGAQRLLFGTEYPLQHPSVELAKFASLDLDPECWRQIAWSNACQLLGEDPHDQHDNTDVRPVGKQAGTA
jgi:predicted TIM-barrel fold metal-dependent hydrolase